MKNWLPIVSLVAGFAVGFTLFVLSNWQIPSQYALYISVAALAGLDTVCGGIKAGIEGRFQNDIFASGFLLNTVLAALLAWFGDHIGVDLALVAVLVLGQRIFLNLSLIRRVYLNTRALNKKRQEEAVPVVSANPVMTQKPEIGGI